MRKSKRVKPGRGVDATGRSTGEPAHVRLYHWEIKSAAYRSLSLVARALLIILKALYNGRNNGELFCSVRHAARLLGVGKNLAHKGFCELETKGFIRSNQRGSFAWKRGAATTWILTEFSVSDGLPTKDFMRWHPPAATAAKKKRKTVSVSGTSGPSGGDSDADDRAKCPLPRDSRHPNPLGAGAHGGDTVKLPCGSAAE